MDVVEAFETLGLEEPDELTAEQLKRSYLRKVRQHPPERDPNGFQRVRQAYELLQQRAGSWRPPTLARAAEPAPPPGASPRAPSAPQTATPPGPPAPATGPIEPASAATATPNDALPRLRTALEQGKWVSA